MKKVVFQFVDDLTGIRSDVFSGECDKLANILASTEGVNPDHFVLVVMEQNGEDEFIFSRAPVMKVSSFIELFSQVLSEGSGDG